MAYVIQKDRLVVVDQPNEYGYEGPVGTIPPRMLRAYEDFVERFLDDWGATEAVQPVPVVWPCYTTTNRRPILWLTWRGPEMGTGAIAVDNEGAQFVLSAPEMRSSSWDFLAWFRELTGSLEALTDEFVRYTAEESQWPESIEEAERRGFEPEEIELDPGPVTHNEATIDVTIVGPNLRDQSKGDFHVHAAGCEDLHRDPNMKDAETLTMPASSLQDVVETIFSDMIDEASPASAFVGEFHVAPCVRWPLAGRLSEQTPTVDPLASMRGPDGALGTDADHAERILDAEAAAQEISDDDDEKVARREAVDAAAERDRQTANALKRAADAMAEALRLMPNSVHSRYDGDDARRLSEYLRDVRLMEAASAPEHTR